MDTLGAEVGQKMRSAIKAKLMELECYVDDELPDYIMVMVANKRTKSQMSEDLNLFLSTKTSLFVNWLHIVLKKLKEVTVTNPEVYKKVTKRKIDENVVKKERKEKKVKKEGENSQEKSLTDDLPITANQLSEQRKMSRLCYENRNRDVLDDNFDIPLLSEVGVSNDVQLEDIERKIKSVKNRLGLLVESDDDEFDCLTLKTEKDELFPKNDETADNFISTARKISIVNDEQVTKSLENANYNKNILENIEENTTKTSIEKKREQHKRIIFDEEEKEQKEEEAIKTTPPKKLSVLERLGKRSLDVSDTLQNRKKISLTEYRKEEERFLRYSRHDNEENERRNKIEKRRSRSRSGDRKRDGDRTGRKENVSSRLGVMSKVSVPQKTTTEHRVEDAEDEEEEEEEEEVVRVVPSLIKVKPRVIPPDVPQANKNLLLKAVADAQRSIAQTPKVGNTAKPDALFTKKYKEKQLESRDKKNRNKSVPLRKLAENEKSKLRNLISQSTRDNTKHTETEDDYDDNGEYIPKPLSKRTQNHVSNYVPSTKRTDDEESDNGPDVVKQTFVITLDGGDKAKMPEKVLTIKDRLEGRKTPSPIVFDKVTTVTTTVRAKPNIPDKLPIVHPPIALKNKERCKYWPNCRQGDKCEFVHPSSNCDAFPHCKFADGCLFLHPTCKFGSSCTKRDCPYSHSFITKTPIGSRSVAVLQNCKFFPNCTNPSCPFLHPKPCKFGKYCKNQPDCIFSHTFAMNKSSLSWRSK